MDSIIISVSTPILIYGSGETGSYCAQRLISKGYNLLAALDKNTAGNIINGIYTYKLGLEPEFNYPKDNIVVVICLADGRLHKTAADQLYQYGYSKIVFLPLNHCIQDCEKSRLNQLYNYVLNANDKISSDFCSIFNYKKYIYPDLSIQNSIIKDNGDTYIVWMGVELLFTESLELWKGDKNKIFEKDETKDIHILSGHPYENLFSYFSSNALNLNEYFNGFKKPKTEEQKDILLKTEEHLFWIFKQAHNKGMGFFIDSASPVIWNPKNYFNLVGGHHRAFFLLNEGHSLFPVVITKEDFGIWCNPKAYLQLVHYITQNNIQKLYSPIPHPGMLNFPSECELSSHSKLRAILRYLSKKNIIAATILDYSRGEGYYARCLSRCKIGYAEYRSEDLNTLRLTQLIYNLLYISNVTFVQSSIYDIENTYDIVFILDKFCDITDSHEKKEIYNKLNHITTSYLFWECCCESEMDDILDNTQFGTYTILLTEFRNGKVWQTCVFTKEALNG